MTAQLNRIHTSTRTGSFSTTSQPSRQLSRVLWGITYSLIIMIVCRQDALLQILLTAMLGDALCCLAEGPQGQFHQALQAADTACRAARAGGPPVQPIAPLTFAVGTLTFRTYSVCVEV